MEHLLFTKVVDVETRWLWLFWGFSGIILNIYGFMITD